MWSIWHSSIPFCSGAFRHDPKGNKGLRREGLSLFGEGEYSSQTSFDREAKIQLLSKAPLRWRRRESVHRSLRERKSSHFLVEMGPRGLFAKEQWKHDIGWRPSRVRYQLVDSNNSQLLERGGSGGEREGERQRRREREIPQLLLLHTHSVRHRLQRPFKGISYWGTRTTSHHKESKKLIVDLHEKRVPRIHFLLDSSTGKPLVPPFTPATLTTSSQELMCSIILKVNT